MALYDLVVFDMDGVLVDETSSWVYIHQHFGTNNEASLERYNRGEIDDHMFMRSDIELWHSRKKPIFYSEIVEILNHAPLMRGAVETIQTLRRAGVSTAIVSGGLLPLAKRVAQETGIEHILANDLVVGPNGDLMGEGLLSVELKNKAPPLLSITKKLGVPLERTAAVGNSYIDAPMLKNAGLGIAFDPMDETVLGAADVVIHDKDLRLILPFLGLN